MTRIKKENLSTVEKGVRKMKPGIYILCVGILIVQILNAIGIKSRINQLEAKLKPIPCPEQIIEDCSFPMDLQYDLIVDITEDALKIKAPNLDEKIRQDYATIITQEYFRTGVSPLLIIAIMKVESNFDKNAVSYANATGLMQVHVPSWHKRYKMTQSQFKQALKIPRFNVYTGVNIWLIHLEEASGNTKRGLVYYNGNGKGSNQYAKNVIRHYEDLYKELTEVEKDE